ncbi:MAG: thioredoxin family protein [Dehalococcoidia bacterium]|nr:MAG: thioredoxin family protein [Dehalococcoidia bacterium]
MNIKILGPGCARCHALEKTVREVVSELQINATVEEIKDMKKMLEYPILTTPGLVINEQVVSSGQVLGKNEVTQLIVNALDKEERVKGS